MPTNRRIRKCRSINYLCPYRLRVGVSGCAIWKQSCFALYARMSLLTRDELGGPTCRRHRKRLQSCNRCMGPKSARRPLGQRAELLSFQAGAERRHDHAFRSVEGTWDRGELDVSRLVSHRYGRIKRSSLGARRSGHGGLACNESGPESHRKILP